MRTLNLSTQHPTFQNQLKLTLIQFTNMLAPTSHTFPINSQFSHKKKTHEILAIKAFLQLHIAQLVLFIQFIRSSRALSLWSWVENNFLFSPTPAVEPSRLVSTTGQAIKHFFFYFSSICCVYADCQLIGQSVLCGKNWALSRWNIVQFFSVEQDEIKLRTEKSC